MNLEDKKQQLLASIKKAEETIQSCKNELERISLKKQLDTIDLYNGIEKYFTHSIKREEYEHILGGDGRSSAWSEKRIGDVLKISINKDVFLSSDQIEIVENYLKLKYDFDNIKYETKSNN
jgi:hypothetical protein